MLGDKLETEVTTPGPPPRGYFIGRCSQFVMVFGCYRFLEGGTKTQGPVVLDGPPPDTMCVD